jgi:RNA polymerase sigma-70 factor (family 1)
VVEDRKLIIKLCEGDSHAYETLFKYYYPKLTLFANRFTNDMIAAEEITGELFIKLWEKRQELNQTVPLKAYLYKSVQNMCLNYLKHQKVESLYIKYLQRNNLLENCFADSESKYLDKELALRLKSAISSLPEKCQQVFIMSRYEDMKYREIAVKLDISVKTVERHMSIALERLRIIMKYVPYHVDG